MIADMLVLLGIGLVAAGLWMVWPPLGVIAVGVAALKIGTGLHGTRGPVNDR